MTSHRSIVLSVRASPHLWSQNRKEMIVAVSATDTVLSVCQCLSALIGCPVDDLHVFHRGIYLVRSVGLLWEDIPWLRSFPYLEVCVRSQRPQIFEELCLVELEHERRKAFGRMMGSINCRFCYGRLDPFSREEVRYLEICAVICRIDLRISHLAALHNVIVCYMREVIQVYDLPQAWVKRESRRIMKWIQFRKSRLLQRRALLSLRR